VTVASARLGDILVREFNIARITVEQAASTHAANGRRLGEELVALGLVDESIVYRALAAQFGLAVASVDQVEAAFDPAVSRGVHRAFLEKHRVLPYAREGATLLVVTCEPREDLSLVAKAMRAPSVRVALVTASDFARLWRLVELRASERPTIAPDAPQHDQLITRGMDREVRSVALFDALLLEAIARRASDLHVERYGAAVRVRFRIDGDLHDYAGLPLSVEDVEGLVNVVKVQAQLDISERRLPQGGRIRRRAGDKAFDLRVQTQPALWGEHLVLRLLPQEQRLLSIEELGMPGDLAVQFRRLLDAPGGLLLVVGPTGSGKSTTLYAGLQHIAQDETRKVITVEDPIEYAVVGVQQTQVRPELGLQFAAAMRAFVREDPDVILVGEIRDAETALEAIRASQTGHLVLSTLHCNDATDAVQRLLDLGMQPNSIASELVAVVAQRLARRVCEHCRERATLPDALARELFPQGIEAGFECFKGRGCERCQGHGTRGRVAAIEYLRSTAEVRGAIARRSTVDELRAVALRAGLRPMRESALDLVRRGVIPVDELPWLLPPERMARERYTSVATP
jgi:type IV pilus assembly protein PilB